MSFFEVINSSLAKENLPVPCFRAVLIGEYALQLEGVLSIKEFSSEKIIVKIKKGELSVSGRGLYIKKYCLGDLVVCGKIVAIERIQG